MSPDSARSTVVVAHPDTTVCEVLARVVEAGGYEAVRVTDESLVAGAVTSAPAQGLVLDLGPGNTKALQELRAKDAARAANTRAVVISTGPAAALLAWQAGCDAVLTRPFPAEDLHSALAEVLARSDEDRAATRAAQVADLT